MGVLCLELWSQEIYEKIDFNLNHVSHMIHAEQHAVQQYINLDPCTLQSTLIHAHYSNQY
jgi:hypothetical protein